MTQQNSFIVPVRPRIHLAPPRSQVKQARPIRARFENAITTYDNQRKFHYSDAMSIDAAANPSVRYMLRNRARQEYHNGSYLHGIAQTIGDYVIGTGPQLQMTTNNKAFNKRVEKLFGDWAEEVGLARTFKTMRIARLISGEALQIIGHDPEMESPIQMSLAEVECDRLSAPALGMLPGQYSVDFLDGIELSPYGRPMIYHVLINHPGGSSNYLPVGSQSVPWPAKYVLHDFRPIRPEQRRGVSEIAPALNLFVNIRGYSVSVMTIAENAANLGMTIETDAAANAGVENADPDEPKSFERVPLIRGEAVAMPKDWHLRQTKPEQPTTMYESFVAAQLQEAVRCTGLPAIFTTMTAAGTNMSSAYVLMQPFAKGVEVDRATNYEPKLRRIMKEFLREASLVPGLLPNDSPANPTFAWRWPKIGEHADPAKVATGHDKDLKNGLNSIPQILAARGLDWEEVQAADALSLGMTVPEYQAALRQLRFATPGNPTPASLDPEPTVIPSDDPDPDSLPDEDEE